MKFARLLRAIGFALLAAYFSSLAFADAKLVASNEKYASTLQELNVPDFKIFSQKLQRSAGWHQAERTVNVLKRAQLWLQDGNAQGAQQELAKLSLLEMATELRAVAFILTLRTRMQLAEFAGVISFVNKWEGGLPKSRFSAEVSALYFTAAVRLGLFESARMRLNFNREDFVNLSRFSFFQIADLEKTLDWYEKRDHAKFQRIATAWGNPDGVFFPDAVLSYAAQQKMCQPTHWQEYAWESQEARRSAGELLSKAGEFDDVREFAFASIGLSLAKIATQSSAEDLKIVEFLQGVRRSDLSLSVTEKLVEICGKAQDCAFLDRLWFLHGRALNSVKKYAEAANFYRRVFEKFPASAYAKDARQRYLLTLMYANEYKKVSAEAKQLMFELPSRAVGRWAGFWASYLGNSPSELALYSGMARGDFETLRSRYWNARSFEKRGEKARAVGLYKNIEESSESTLYALFASWRLRILTGKQVNNNLVNNNLANNKVAAVNPVEGVLNLSAKTANGLNSDFSSNLNPDFGLHSKNKEIQNAPSFELLLKNKNAVALLQSSLLLRRAGLKEFVGIELEINQKSIAMLPPEVRILLSYALYDYHRASKEISNSRTSFWEGKTRLSSFPTVSGLQNVRDRFTWTVAYPRMYPQLVASLSETHNLPEHLIHSIVRTESFYKPSAESWVGARGLMQLMPSTAQRIAKEMALQEFTLDSLWDPAVNMALGSWYLRYLLNHYQGSLTLAIAAYNAGPVAVDRWLSQDGKMVLDEFIENIPFEQTRKYVEKVLLSMSAYQKIYHHSPVGFQIVEKEALVTPSSATNLF